MKLLKETESVRDKKGILRKWGIFECSNCLQEVEKTLSNGYKQKSCGCQKIEFNNQSGINNLSFKHGEFGTKIYSIYYGILARCNNPKSKAYKDYGGRDITVCPEWTESYIEFRDWALNNGYQKGLEIDRRDNNGNYNPSNCRWVTKTEQNRNQRRTKLTLEKANEIRVKYNSGYYTQKQLAKEYIVSRQLISVIIRNELWKNE